MNIHFSIPKTKPWEMKTTADKNSQYSLIKRKPYHNFPNHAKAAVVTLNHVLVVALICNFEVGLLSGGGCTR